MAKCIWSLLSSEGLKFVHVSYFEKLKGQSLFDLIHPDEVLLARRDLSMFISTNRLGGSVTSCRMKNYTDECTSPWIVVDVVMYNVTKNLVLCFLHQQDKFFTGNSCHIINECSLSQLSIDLISRETQSPSMSSSSSLSSTETLLEDNLPQQTFYILNNQTKTVLLSWADNYPDESHNNSDMLNLIDGRYISNTGCCLHSVQRTPRSDSICPKTNTILINYGELSFVLVSIEKSSITKQNITSTHNNIPKRTQIKRKHQPYPSILSENNILTVKFNHHQNKQSVPHRIYCQSCGTNSSPEWRRGPTGHKTLCNACGLRYSRSVARQEKLASQQKKKLSLFQSQNTPHERTTIQPLLYSMEHHYKKNIHYTI